MRTATFFALVLLFALGGAIEAAPPRISQSLKGITIVLDPGHGDLGSPDGTVAADPGAMGESLEGPAAECVFAWDTAMRVRHEALLRGAKVYLTLEANQDELEICDWAALPVAGRDFRYKAVQGCPAPVSTQEALLARVNWANRIYAQCKAESDVYFFSLHFDSTSPSVSGVSFYYPMLRRTDFIRTLQSTIREAGMARKDIETGAEVTLSQPATYAVLNHADNPDSYLLELGNLRTQDGSDLITMRSARGRQAYADLIIKSLEKKGGAAPRLTGGNLRRPWRKLHIALGTLGALAGLALIWGRPRRRRRKRRYKASRKNEAISNTTKVRSRRTDDPS